MESFQNDTIQFEIPCCLKVPIRLPFASITQDNKELKSSMRNIINVDQLTRKEAPAWRNCWICIGQSTSMKKLLNIHMILLPLINFISISFHKLEVTS